MNQPLSSVVIETFRERERERFCRIRFQRHPSLSWRAITYIIESNYMGRAKPDVRPPGAAIPSAKSI